MKRDKFMPFVLGFVVGALFMLLAGGLAGGVLIYTLYERVEHERERAAAAEHETLEHRKSAEEQAEGTRQREHEAQQRAEEARREAERRR